MLNIIQNQSYFVNLSDIKILEMIRSRDIRLQNKLCCCLFKCNSNEYHQLVGYFRKFDESRNFFEVEKTLSFEDILYVSKQSIYD